MFCMLPRLEPLHVNKKELHTGHDQPGDIEGQYMSSFHWEKIEIFLHSHWGEKL